jgi:hypothetical protein
MLSKTNIPVFFWSEEGQVNKGWTTGNSTSEKWLELELVRGINSGYSVRRQIAVEQVILVLAENSYFREDSVHLQKNLDRIMARNPIPLLMDCLQEKMMCSKDPTTVFLQAPGFWERWESMQMMALRYPAPTDEAASFSLIERECAALLIDRLNKKFAQSRGIRDAHGVSQEEYAKQLPALAALNDQAVRGNLRISSLAKMVSRLVEGAEWNLRRRMIGETVEKSPFLFHVDHFVAAYPGEVDRCALMQWLSERSVQPGEWEKHSPEWLQRERPIRTRPLIRLEQGWFAWPLVGGAGRHAWDWLLLSEFGGDKAAPRGRENRKATLCDRVMTLFQQSFPQASIYKGVRWWDDSGQVGTLDAAIWIPPFLFALRTETAEMNEVRTGMGELARLYQAWEYQWTSVRFDLKTRGVTCSHLVALLVTMEPINGAFTKDTIQRGFSLYSLSELQNLFFLLDGRIRKTDYLWKKSRATVTGEEWQQLSSYLLTGSPDHRKSLATQKRKGTGLRPFLSYLERAWEGKRVSLSEGPYTHWWRAMLQKLDKSDMSEALWIGMHLASVDLQTQNRFEQEIKRIKQQTRQEKDPSDPIVWIQSHRLIGGVIHPEEERKHPIYLRHTGLRKQLLRHSDPWVFIQFHRDAYRYPYSAIQLIFS